MGLLNGPLISQKLYREETSKLKYAGMMELADVRDSKSAASKIVPVSESLDGSGFSTT